MFGKKATGGQVEVLVERLLDDRRFLAHVRASKSPKVGSEVVLEDKKPLLGICLGMQLLCNSSDEDTGMRGLGYINAECKKFEKKSLKVPHVGFNQVAPNPEAKIYEGFDKSSDFYFTHSYRLESNCDIRQSLCHYGENFIASYEKNNIIGTQFHPELSQTNGLKLLNNFLSKFEYA